MIAKLSRANDSMCKIRKTLMFILKKQFTLQSLTYT